MPTLVKLSMPVEAAERLNKLVDEGVLSRDDQGRIIWDDEAIAKFLKDRPPIERITCPDCDGHGFLIREDTSAYYGYPNNDGFHSPACYAQNDGRIVDDLSDHETKPCTCFMGTRVSRNIEKEEPNDRTSEVSTEDGTDLSDRQP